jgi:glycosyltransferase involved in cell wall biosynthesis
MGNEAAAEVWRAKGYEGPYRIIPQFGVDPAIFHPPLRRDPGRTFIIGSAGRRLVREKGNHILLQAAAGLPGVWRIHIAGTGPERAPLEKLARELGVADRVVFDGVIPSAQMPDYLRQIDALVLPSLTLPNWKEQFGRILVEAMACEVAVIGSDSGEIPNVVADAGLIFPEGDSAALRSHLQRLMWEDGRRDALGRAGRQRVLGYYTQAQIASRTVQVYREMLGMAMRPRQARADVSVS